MQVWDRQKGEEAAAFELFAEFRDSGSRNIGKVVESHPRAKSWIKRNRWVDRADAYDRFFAHHNCEIDDDILNALQKRVREELSGEISTKDAVNLLSSFEKLINERSRSRQEKNLQNENPVPKMIREFAEKICKNKKASELAGMILTLIGNE